MRHRAGLIVLLGSLLAGPDLAACGDKFLVVGRGTRFQRGPEPGRGYSVLVYAPPTSPLGDARHRSAVEKTLVKAGYKPATAGSFGELAESLQARPDLVIADVADARAVEGRLGRAPMVLLKAPISANALLDAVDAAVRRIARGGVAAASQP